MLVYFLFVLCLLTHKLIKTQNETSFEEENSKLELAENCSCVLNYQCDDDGYVRLYGEGIFNWRSGDRTPFEPKICKGGKFPGQLYCCKKLDVEVQPKSPNIDNVPSSTSKPPKKDRCGVQRPNINVRVFNGENELTPVKGEFPWSAAIFKKDSGIYQYYAGGCLIHPKVILTVNHYFNRKKTNLFKVIINGNIELSAVGENVADERNVTEIVNHPEYSSGSLANDVTLLILDEPYVIQSGNYINNICIPPENVNLTGRRCLTAGWGKGSDKIGKVIMKKVELPYVDRDTCQDLLRKNTDLRSDFELEPSSMCAGGEKGKDSCKGDGGSPLMCTLPETGQYFVAGLVSWGRGCGQENVPGIYADVVNAREWILKELKKREIVTND